MTSPRISVIIPAFNAAMTIERAVLSALAEDQVREVLVINDASRDDTSARVMELIQKDPRTKLIDLTKNIGPAAARNMAFERASADIVALLDADDYFLPGRIKGMLEDASGENWDFLADELSLDGVSAVASERRKASFVSLDHFLSHNIERGPYLLELGFLKPLMKREFLRRHGLKYDPQLRFGEDMEFYARALIAGCRFLLLPAHGYVVVDTPMSLSKRQGLADFTRLRDCLSRLDTPDTRSVWKKYFRFLDTRIAQLDLLLTPYPQRLWGVARLALARPRIFVGVCRMVVKDKLRAPERDDASSL